METIEKQQAIALEALRITREFYPPALIAGGAPRDWIAGRVAHDIDIFLWDDNENTGSLDKIINLLGCDEEDLVDKSSAPRGEYTNNCITEVWELEYKDQLIQWIFIAMNKGFRSLEEFVCETFDIDICKCFFNHSGEIILTDEAKADFDNKTLTIDLENCRRYDRISALPRRSKKIQQYFPDHRIVLTGNFSEVSKVKEIVLD